MTVDIKWRLFSARGKTAAFKRIVYTLIMVCYLSLQLVEKEG